MNLTYKGLIEYIETLPEPIKTHYRMGLKSTPPAPFFTLEGEPIYIIDDTNTSTETNS